MVCALLEGREKSLELSPGLSHSKAWPICLCSWKISPWDRCQSPAWRPHWSGIWAQLFNPNSKESCTMGPSEFRQRVSKTTDGTVKNRGSSFPPYHPMWWPHGNMSCLLMKILMSTCFVQGIPRSIWHGSCSHRGQKVNNKHIRNKMAVHD